MVQYVKRNKEKRWKVLLFVGLFFLSARSTVEAKPLPFIDVDVETPYYEALKTTYDSGVIHGISDLLYKPEEPVTHAQVIKLPHASMN